MMTSKDNSRLMGWRRIAFDVPVVLLVASAVVFPIILMRIGDSHTRGVAERLIGLPLTIAGNAYLLVWMLVGAGSRSSLWRWCPPFWPWGLILKGSSSRLAFVSLVVLGSLVAVLASYDLLPFLGSSYT